MDPRRHRLLKRFACADRQDDDLAAVWRAKQEALTGQDLPDDFIHRAALVAAGYSTVEDIDGASADELVKRAGLSRREGLAVLTQIAALT